jgi:anti-sigma regulatory factor (Ser/Thr protein kinase)
MEMMLPPTARAAGMARRATKAELPDCPAEVVETAVLLASELVTNSVRHAGLGPEGTVGLSIQVRPDRVRVEVSDSGPGFPPRPAPPDPGEGGSLGLLLVEKLSDAWGLTNHPCRVWFEIVTTDRSSRGEETAGAGSDGFEQD